MRDNEANKSTLYQVLISGFVQNEVWSLFSEVGQQTAVGHKRHDNIGSRASIDADTNEIHDIGMVELLHLHTLLHDLVDLILIKEP